LRGLAVEHAALADVDGARLRALQAGHGAQQRGLAAARRAQQRHHFAALQVHRHAFQDRVGGGAAAIVEVQVVDGQNVHGDVSRR
jgi:hypothetical protein